MWAEWLFFAEPKDKYLRCLWNAFVVDFLLLSLLFAEIPWQNSFELIMHCLWVMAVMHFQVKWL